MTGLAANSKFGPNVKLEDNAEQLPSAYIDKEKLPEKLLEGGGGGGGVDVEPTVDAAAVEVFTLLVADAPPAVDVAFSNECNIRFAECVVRFARLSESSAPFSEFP